MKTMLRLIVASVVSFQIGFCADEVSTVPFELGPTHFRNGDQIVIEHVLATSPNLAVGDKVTVQGHYVLQSEQKAQLCFYLTTSDAVGAESTFPTQKAEVQKGSGSFELTEVLKHPGHLHLSFYPATGGSRLGTVYFGTEQQMKEISNWNVTD
jgi:hypothetical protein